MYSPNRRNPDPTRKTLKQKVLQRGPAAPFYPYPTEDTRGMHDRTTTSTIAVTESSIDCVHDKVKLKHTGQRFRQLKTTHCLCVA